MKKLTAVKLAEMLKGTLTGDGSIEITGVESLLEADRNEVSFLTNKKKYIDQLESSNAGVILVSNDFDEEVLKNRTYIKCEDHNVAFSAAIDYFALPPIQYKPGIHPSAVIADSAEIAAGCHIGAGVVVEENASVGKNSVICANTYIGHEVKIGSECLIHPSTVIMERCIIGNKVILESNVSIGTDGFAFKPTPFGLAKIPQVGIVRIDDEVEIGSNSTIDRARFGKTWIKTGAKIDSQVMVAHNVVVGEFSMLIGQCGIAGSTTVGKGVIIAAQAGINGHILLGDGSRVGPCSVVKNDVDPNTSVIGIPAELPKGFMSRHMLPKTVKRMKDKLRKLESILEAATKK